MNPIQCPRDALRRLADTPFFGRASLLSAARLALEAALSGRSQSFLIVGEAGIGKTRIADELVAIARADGLRPVWARCHALDGAPAFWPWIQIARALLAEFEASERGEWLDGEGAALARLVPELARSATGAGSDPNEHATHRYALFESLTALLRRSARATPLLVLLDDLHWADPASVLLAHYAMRELRQESIVFVGLYRDTDLDSDTALARALGDLGRDSEVFHLEGLADTEVKHLVEHVAGNEISQIQLGALQTQTGGNPFFLVEILRMLVQDDALAGLGTETSQALRLPPTVRHILERRLENLAPTSLAMLRQASVLGREFDLETLGDALAREAPFPHLGRSLDEALGARLIYRGSGGVGRFRFAHDLIRETLDAGLSMRQRIMLHRHAADAIVRTRANALEEHYAALALHYLESAASGTAREAADYATRGGERAAAKFSFELALQLFHHALRALDFLAADAELAPGTLALRAQILLRMGDVLWQSGQRSDAREAYRGAESLARQIGDFEILSETAIGLSGRDDMAMTVSIESVRRLEEALAGLPKTDSRLRVRLLTHLVRATYFGEDRKRLFEWSSEARAMAERLDDPTTRLAALESFHYALLMPQHLEERLFLSARFPDLAREALSLRMEGVAWLWRAYDLIQVPDVTAADLAILRFTEIADQLRQPFYQWLALGMRATRAQMEGDLERTERLVFETLEMGQRAATPNAILFFGTQLFHLRAEQGRVDELLPVMQKIVDDRQALPVFRIGIPLIHALADREEEARRTFEEVAAHDFEDVPRDLHRLPMLTSAASVCAYLGDLRRAELLRQELLEDEGRIVIGGVVTHWAGPVDRSLGQLEEALGHLDAAARHFENAAKLCARGGARLLEAHSWTEHARVLVARAAPGDLERAGASVARASAIYRAHGITEPLSMVIPHRLRVRVRSKQEAPTRPVQVQHAHPIPVRDARFFRQGADWIIDFDGSIIQLGNTKGLGYLRQLLSQPDEPIHVLDLVALEAPDASEVHAEHPAANGTRRQGASHSTTEPARLVESSLEVLDLSARRAYQARLGELERLEGLAECDRDLARLEAIRLERSQVESELLAAYGYGGIARSAVDPIERARKAVYNRIRDAIRRIETRHASLGRHLKSAIRTGTTCVYRPDAELSWQVSS